MSGHHVVLSRKYRPKDLGDLVGQDILSRSLRTCLDSKKMPHAFLFHGIRGVGKTTTARILARCLNCIGPDGETNITSSPCGTCKSCLAMDRDQHVDVMEFDAASRTGVDDIREIIDGTQYMPILRRYKIFIIDEVHMLSKSAFNALLKTLEEPPAHVKFIFATTEVRKIPETILSRCMAFQLKPVQREAIVEHLLRIARAEGYTLERAAAEVIAEESEGAVRDSLSILEQAMMLVSDAETITDELVISMLGGAREADIESLLEDILNGRTTDSLARMEGLIDGGSDPFVLYRKLQTALYKMITCCIKGERTNYNLSNLLYIWQILLRQTENMKSTDSPEMIFNAAIVIASHTSTFPSIEDLVIKTKATSTGDPTNRLVEEVLSTFHGTSAFEVE
jgi:DNA polymerase-3 subunit gamma/tau